MSKLSVLNNSPIYSRLKDAVLKSWLVCLIVENCASINFNHDSSPIKWAKLWWWSPVEVAHRSQKRRGQQTGVHHYVFGRRAHQAAQDVLYILRLWVSRRCSSDLRWESGQRFWDGVWTVRYAWGWEIGLARCSRGVVFTDPWIIASQREAVFHFGSSWNCAAVWKQRVTQ